MSAEAPRPGPHHLPSKFEERVFVGGNYDEMYRLRKIVGYVRKAGFEPIFPWDYEIAKDPPSVTHDWDIRILHQCQYAIFEVTHPGGELMEIERTHEYKTRTLLLWDSRDPASAKPPKVTTMLMGSGRHERRSYTTDEDLETAVQEFLCQKAPGLFQDAVNVYGWRFGRLVCDDAFGRDGSSQRTQRYENLKVEPGRKIFEIRHDFWLTEPGKIVEFVDSMDGSGLLKWYLDEVRSGERSKVGVVRCSNGLDSEQPELSYGFSMSATNAYALKRDEIRANPTDELLSTGHEYAGIRVSHPTEELVLTVTFEAEDLIEGEPRFVAYPRESVDAFRMPPDKFNIEGNKATLTVRRPLIFHDYFIYWLVPSGGERA